MGATPIGASILLIFNFYAIIYSNINLSNEALLLPGRLSSAEPVANPLKFQSLTCSRTIGEYMNKMHLAAGLALSAGSFLPMTYESSTVYADAQRTCVDAQGGSIDPTDSINTPEIQRVVYAEFVLRAHP